MLLRMSLSPRVSVSAAAGRAAIAAPPPTTHVFAYARAMRPASTMRTHASHRSSMALRSLVTAANARLNQFHQQQQQQQEQQQNREDSRTHEEESRRDDTRSGSRFSFWTPFRFIGRQARLAFDWYARRLDTSPVITQSLTSGFLFLIGDITAQRYEDRLDRDKGIDTSDRPYLDLKRVAACTSFGLFVLGPFGHYWYSRLDVWTNRLYAPRTMKNVGMKVLLDTAIFNPIFLIVFFTVVSLLEGLTMNDIGHKLYRDFVPSYAVDCSVWPPIQTVNFRFVPVKFQLLVVNLGCYFDDVFLSYGHQRKRDTRPRQPQRAVDTSLTPHLFFCLPSFSSLPTPFFQLCAAQRYAVDLPVDRARLARVDRRREYSRPEAGRRTR